MSAEEQIAIDGIIGQQMPEWELANWINSCPLTPGDLSGRVVLLRWWAGKICPHCVATTSALSNFFKQYQSRGLLVLGVYHHKGGAPFRLEDLQSTIQEAEILFPIAVDKEWKTLHRWWLSREGARLTSVSFLIDRRGVVRYVHPGGRIVKGDPAYFELESKILELLAQNTP